MSLKSFHVFFVVASVLCALFFGAWGLVGYTRGGGIGYLAIAGGSAAAAAALVVYGAWFLRKLRGVDA